MSNTDWKGRVSKLYDQISGNVSITLVAAVVIANTKRFVTDSNYCRPLTPKQS